MQREDTGRTTAAYMGDTAGSFDRALSCYPLQLREVGCESSDLLLLRQPEIGERTPEPLLLHLELFHERRARQVLGVPLVLLDERFPRGCRDGRGKEAVPERDLL